MVFSLMWGFGEIKGFDVVINSAPNRGLHVAPIMPLILLGENSTKLCYYD